jgi:hypothetical protein
MFWGLLRAQPLWRKEGTEPGHKTGEGPARDLASQARRRFRVATATVKADDDILNNGHSFGHSFGLPI